MRSGKCPDHNSINHACRLPMLVVHQCLALSSLLASCTHRDASPGYRAEPVRGRNRQMAASSRTQPWLTKTERNRKTKRDGERGLARDQSPPISSHDTVIALRAH
ncbi:hypothetical protein RRG08_047045 [Elysia crispata]|uniref:Secreted protein n=1 Tax=Elysia crispata TaxID=231223 RepID=A0AAE1AVY0_9GAST|nr:hypothetical protein RRG08_047045 [Elysia crispata]